MNFKALALGATLALGSIFGSVTPAEAGTCLELKGSRIINSGWCHIQPNDNNTQWYVSMGDTRTNFIFMENGVVKLVNVDSPSDSGYANWYIDRQGYVRIAAPGADTELSLRL